MVSKLKSKKVVESVTLTQETRTENVDVRLKGQIPRMLLIQKHRLKGRRTKCTVSKDKG